MKNILLMFFAFVVMAGGAYAHQAEIQTDSFFIAGDDQVYDKNIVVAGGLLPGLSKPSDNRLGSKSVAFETHLLVTARQRFETAWRS